MRLRGAAFILICGLSLSWTTTAQQQPPSSNTEVRPIDPGGVVLPDESASAGDTKFSFIAYGDTRGAADGYTVQAQHKDVVEKIISTIPAQEKAGFPVRFIVQSGDAVTDGRFGEQWNMSFTPLIERLIREGKVPYFFAVGNHDVGTMPVGTPDREAGLHNATAAMSKLWPPEGSSRRLKGYPTFAFGYGRFYFIALDSNIPADPVQLAWVAKQLEGLDRRRYPHVIALFHHPPLTTGPHGGPLVERQAQLLRRVYLPLFRAHHVRMTITGHDHLYDHFIEHYEDRAGTHRMDHIVSGGGGAPIYSYRGEQDLKAYAAVAPPQAVRVEHPMRPGVQQADNPHHFVIFEVDGDRIWLQVVSTVAAPFLPYKEPRIELADR